MDPEYITLEEANRTIGGVIAWLAGIGENASLSGPGLLPGEEMVLVPNPPRAARILRLVMMTAGHG